MRWPLRAFGGVRCALIVACALLVGVGGFSSCVAWADPASVPTYSDEQRAEELYVDGVEKLAAGHSDFARETFESVVANYPATVAALSARRQLDELRSHAGDVGPEGAVGGQAMPEIGVPVTGSLSVPALAATDTFEAAQPAPSPSWDRELRRNATIQSKLRREAGDRVFFSPGSAELGSRARTALMAQAQWLIHWHEFDAAIEGHADEPGSEEENVVLSQQRAEAVRQRLIEEGVEPTRLAVVPLGRSLRVATCADTDCRAQNRRAVTLVFSSGARERMGLVSVPTLSAAVAKPAPAVVVTPAAATSQTVGVTR